MSGAALEIVPQAVQEIEDAFAWYLERSASAAEAFLAELGRGIDLILESPHLWPHFEAGSRKYVLRKFPYSIIYREIAKGVQIVAVAHHKRRPRYWHGR